MPKVTFAPRGSTEFQDKFADVMLKVGQDAEQALGTNLASLLIGGSFGRGEGAVSRRDGIEKPFNDVDLFLFVHHPHSVSEASLRDIEKRHTEKIGAHVEFSKPIAYKQVPEFKPALMWFDLINGNRPLAGDAEVCKRFSPEVAADVPICEGARLLLNRGAALVWALRIVRGLEDAPDIDFVRRNVFKARLALMDAALILRKTYKTPLAQKIAMYDRWYERHRPRARLLDTPQVREAALFRQDPDALPPHIDFQDADEWVEAFLELESMRFNEAFHSSREYSEFGAAREPAESTRDLAVNLIKNAKNRCLSVKHPRQHLYEQLPALLTSHSKSWPQRSADFLKEWRQLC